MERIEAFFCFPPEVPWETSAAFGLFLSRMMGDTVRIPGPDENVNSPYWKLVSSRVRAIRYEYQYDDERNYLPDSLCLARFVPSRQVPGSPISFPVNRYDGIGEIENVWGHIAKLSPPEKEMCFAWNGVSSLWWITHQGWGGWFVTTGWNDMDSGETMFGTLHRHFVYPPIIMINPLKCFYRQLQLDTHLISVFVSVFHTGLGDFDQGEEMLRRGIAIHKSPEYTEALELAKKSINRIVVVD